MKTGSLRIGTISSVVMVSNDTEKNYITKRNQNSLTCSFATKAIQSTNIIRLQKI